MKNLKINIGVLALSGALLFNSCASTSNQTKGAGIGVGAGAILGAIIGNQIGDGNSELGAVIGAAVGGVAGAAIGKKMDKQAQQIENEIPGAKVEKINNGEGIQVTFDGENKGVTFATAKYNIDAASQETLDKFIKILNMYPDTNIQVQGHTDDVGQDADNMLLSQRRAQAVSNYFTAHGIAASRITTKWFGESQPKVANDSKENQAINRRVEIYITPNEKMIQDAKKEAGQ